MAARMKMVQTIGTQQGKTAVCDLLFLDDVDNGLDTVRAVNETGFQLRVEEGEITSTREGVLIVSVLFPGGHIYHSSITPEQARRLAADLLESASTIDNLNREKLALPLQSGRTK